MPILIKGSGGRKPKLQSKTISPSSNSSYYYPDSGYDGFNEITISASPSPITPTGGNATATDVRKGKTFYSGGNYLTGTMEDVTLPVPTYSTAFQNDNTKLKITSSYTPPVGYVSSTNKVSVSKTLNIPQSSASQAVCEYYTGSIVHSYSDSENYYEWDIRYIEGKTPKYFFITRNSDYFRSVPSDGTMINSIAVDCSLDTAYVSMFNFNDVGEPSESITYKPISTNKFVHFDYSKNSSGNYILTTKAKGVYDGYFYLAIYQ